MSSFLKKFFLNMDDIIASISVILIIAITVLGVFMRFVVGDPLKWTEEASLALFVWLTFFGASSVMKRDEHISIDFLVEISPKPVQKLLVWFKYIVVMLVLIIVFMVLGYELAAHAWAKITPILRIHYTFIDLAVPAGGLLAAIQLIRSILKNKKNHNNDENIKRAG